MISRSEKEAANFLGAGWSFPPLFDRHHHPQASVVMTSDVLNIKQSLWVLFSTELGERIMLATYGSGLRTKVFDALTETLANDIRSLIFKTVLDWEPRIDLTKVEIVESKPLDGVLKIEIEFTVRQTNSRSNMVYPFYLTESTLPPPPL